MSVSPLRVFLGVAAVLVGLAAVAGLGYGLEQARTAWKEHRALVTGAGQWADSAEKYVDAYCADVDRIAQYPFFTEVPSGADAAEFLNPRVGFGFKLRPWRGMPAMTQPTYLPVSPELELSEEVSTGLRQNDWSTLTAPAGLDSSWITRVRPYGRWSLAPGFYEELFPLSALERPELRWRNLLDWAVIHLLNGLERGDARTAAADVRHLGALLLSTGDPVPVAVGVSMLGKEWRAHERARALGHDTAGWEPFDPSIHELFRRVQRGTQLMAAPAVDVEIAKRARACASRTVFGCTFLYEELVFALMLRSGDGVVTTPRVAAVDDAMEAIPARCDERFLHLLWDRDEVLRPEENVRRLERDTHAVAERVGPIRALFLRLVLDRTRSATMSSVGAGAEEAIADLEALYGPAAAAGSAQP